nr:MAG TPA: chitin synthase regulator [Caudoviricetes sp.]
MILFFHILSLFILNNYFINSFLSLVCHLFVFLFLCLCCRIKRRKICRKLTTLLPKNL